MVRTTNQEAAGARTTSPAARTTNGEAASGKDIPGSESKESRRVKIEYLGSIPVENKATDLRSLQVSSGIKKKSTKKCRLYLINGCCFQVPMKSLYLKHIDMKNMGHQHLPGTLEISDTGIP